MDRVKLFLFVLTAFLLHSSARASAFYTVVADTVNAGDTINVPDSLVQVFFSGGQEEIKLIVPDSLNTSKYKIKKRIAAILAFPFPFGLLGLHRVFLGTKPYIPFVYIGTLGGCFLILPVIDFIAILSSDKETFKGFENNPKVFMWAH
jgi:TM2 domain-containing membrane protein YozV